MKPDQKAVLLQYLNAFLADPKIANEGELEQFEVFDEKRNTAIPSLKTLISDFLTAEINLQKFKEEHEIKCREFPYWGFKGFSGQMQINQFVNNIPGQDKESIFRNAVKIPTAEAQAKEKIDALANYIAEKRSSSENPQSLPRPSAVKYVLSYFWEIQEHTKWDVFYNSSKKVLDEIGLSTDAQGSEGQSYLNYLSLIREVMTLYEENTKAKIKYPFWFVEHVLWKQFLNSSTRTGAAIEKQKVVSTISNASKSIAVPQVANEWLPPVIADLGELALNRETPWSQRNNIKPEKALETKVRIAFTLLGYEATELGQGKGRELDGFAISLNVPDGDYAIVYDAKARENYFSVGTSDREMYEYIKRKSEELKKRRVSRSYFLVVSSEFDSNPANLNLVKDVFRRTRIPITMMRGVDILFLIEEKLKDIELTHERLERLFLETGILTREKIVDILGIR
jgi:hypothetical protein